MGMRSPFKYMHIDFMENEQAHIDMRKRNGERVYSLFRCASRTQIHEKCQHDAEMMLSMFGEIATKWGEESLRSENESTVLGNRNTATEGGC